MKNKIKWNEMKNALILNMHNFSYPNSRILEWIKRGLFSGAPSFLMISLYIIMTSSGPPFFTRPGPQKALGGPVYWHKIQQPFLLYQQLRYNSMIKIRKWLLLKEFSLRTIELIMLLQKTIKVICNKLRNFWKIHFVS